MYVLASVAHVQHTESIVCLLLPGLFPSSLLMSLITWLVVDSS